MKKIFYLLLAVVLFASCSSKPTPIDLNVMTFNIRLNVASDSLNSWPYRKDVAAQVIQDGNIDIVGTQEVFAGQLNDLKNSLPGYASVGVGREDGIDKGEYSAILYKKDRFTEIKSGTFWLSETPEVAGSKGWDAACERVGTWAVLQDKATQREVFFINTHLDHMGVKARQNGVTLLLDRATELGGGIPIIMTGDFNATPDSDVIHHVIEKSNPHHLIHTKDIAATTSGTEWTFHDFGRLPENEREFIDYIFVSQGIEVAKHSVLATKIGDTFVSDHAPVMAQITIR